MRLCNVQVAVRVKEGTSTFQLLPAVRSKAEIDGRELILQCEDTISRSELDVCVLNVNNNSQGAASAGENKAVLRGGEDDDANLFVKTNGHKLLSLLFDGISVAILGMGVDGGKPGGFGSFIGFTLDRLEELIGAKESTKVTVSFSLFGVSDTSCIDLVTFARKEVSELGALRGDVWGSLEEVPSITKVKECVAQGYSLPCVLLLKLVNRREGGSPAKVATLLLADLGSIGTTGSPLEKSYAHISSLIGDLISYQTNVSNFSSNSRESSTSSYLMSLLDGVWGGNCATLVVGDVPRSGVARAMNTFVNLLSLMRRVKNRPEPTIETDEMIELALLVEAHGKLEVEHGAVRRELKQLYKALKISELQRKDLEIEWERTGNRDLVKSVELEYEITRMAMDKLTVQERIRQCEIDFVCMEHARLIVVAEMEVKKQQIAALEESLMDAFSAKEEHTRSSDKQIDGLKDELNAVHSKLESSENEKNRLRAELKEAGTKIKELEMLINKVEKESDKRAGTLKSQYERDLQSARDAESKLVRKLEGLEQGSRESQAKMELLEKQLSSLRMENVSLTAQMQILTAQQPRSPMINKTIAAMEEKWKNEREAMQTVMSDLRQMISNKDIAEPKARRSVDGDAAVPVPKTALQAVVPGNPISVLKKSGDRKKESPGRTTKPPRKVTIVSPPKENEIIDGGNGKVRLTRSKSKGGVEEEADSSSAPLTRIFSEEKVGIGAGSKRGSGKKTTKEAAKASPVKDEVLTTIEVTEVLGTPQKVAAPTVTVSPAKVWKPSAFIPGVTRKVGENGGSLFANLNFGQPTGAGVGGGDDGGQRKRIKLPERVKSVSEGDSLPLTVTTRRNVDPTVYSTIMGSFNIPPMQK